jgi:hypothetical protein
MMTEVDWVVAIWTAPLILALSTNLLAGAYAMARDSLIMSLIKQLPEVVKQIEIKTKETK